MKSNGHSITTKATPVEILLLDGSLIPGKISVPVQGRLTDVLNDARSFLPVECQDGTFLALAKRAIKQVLLPGAEAAAYKGSDPYVILGVADDVSPEQLKKTYHHLCALNHPDRIRGLGLGAEYEQLATQNMSRINGAYAQISKKFAN
jgi:hypothetical protein